MSETELLNVREELFRAVMASGRLAPWQNSQTDLALAQRHFNSAAFDKPEVAAAEAGRILGVDYVIYSKMYYSEERWVLDTGLLDVAGRSVVRFMRGRYTGTEQQVSRQGAHMNIERLLDIEDHAPVAAPPIAPPQPAQVRPAPVTATPTIQPPVPPEQRRTTPTAAVPTVEPPLPRREFTHPREPVKHHEKRLDVGIRLPRNAPPVFISWMLLPYLGIEFNYNYNLEIDVKQNDVKAGTYSAQNIGTSLFLRYSDELIAGRWSIPLRLQAGAGASLLVDSEFNGERWWRNGFEPDNRQAQRDWVAAGAPDRPNDGLQRAASPSDSLALHLDLTTSLGITQSLFFDIYLQYLYAKVDTEFENIIRGNLESTTDGSIKINDLSAGIGLRYSF